MLLPNKYRQHHQRFVDDFSTSIIQSRQMSSCSIVYGQKKNGSIFPAEISISKIMVSSKLEFTAIVRDISERSRLLEELQHQAMTDGLTGLKNRLFLDKELEREIEQTNNTLSLLLIDLDHFKLVNDGHGHAVGDNVLIGFSKTVSSLLKPHHTFARYGGEEFIVLLPDTNQQQAIKIANELCLACANKVHINDIKCTVSIGVSVFESGVDDADSLIQRADIALYKTKSAGRNCAKFKSCDEETSVVTSN
jgi:diguanylate cyclase (GGDEF)-like protein